MVGPPLSASVGLRTVVTSTPTWLPLVPLTRPPLPPVPIRLWWLAATTLSAYTSSGKPAPWRLPATIVLYSEVAPKKALDAATAAAAVEAGGVNDVAGQRTVGHRQRAVAGDAAAQFAAEFPERVLLVTVSVRRKRL